jgi:hypothetical protein
MSKRFFHKFLLNDTFAPAERFNSELGIGHYWPDVPMGAVAGVVGI